jgi:hypothetical protein
MQEQSVRRRFDYLGPRYPCGPARHPSHPCSIQRRGRAQARGRGLRSVASPNERSRQLRWPHSWSWPNILPIFRLTKCNLRQAGQETLSYSSSGASSSSSSQCWTFIDVSGHLKMKGAMRPLLTEDGALGVPRSPEPRQPGIASQQGDQLRPARASIMPIGLWVGPF